MNKRDVLKEMFALTFLSGFLFGISCTLIKSTPVIIVTVLIVFALGAKAVLLGMKYFPEAMDTEEANNG
jgi:hypothetical protein